MRDIIITKLRADKLFKWEYSNLWKDTCTLNSLNQSSRHKIIADQLYNGVSNKK